jgi:integrase
MLFKVYSRYIPNLTRMDGSAFEHMIAVTEDKEMADAHSLG